MRRAKGRRWVRMQDVRGRERVDRRVERVSQEWPPSWAGRGKEPLRKARASRDE